MVRRNAFVRSSFGFSKNSFEEPCSTITPSSMKMTLTVISIMAVVIVLIIGAGLDIDVAGSLTGNKIGQVLLLVTGLLYLMVGIKMFKTDK